MGRAKGVRHRTRGQGGGSDASGSATQSTHLQLRISVPLDAPVRDHLRLLAALHRHACTPARGRTQLERARTPQRGSARAAGAGGKVRADVGRRGACGRHALPAGATNMPSTTASASIFAATCCSVLLRVSPVATAVLPTQASTKVLFVLPKPKKAQSRRHVPGGRRGHTRVRKRTPWP